MTTLTITLPDSAAHRLEAMDAAERQAPGAKLEQIAVNELLLASEPKRLRGKELLAELEALPQLRTEPGWSFSREEANER